MVKSCGSLVLHHHAATSNPVPAPNPNPFQRLCRGQVAGFPVTG
jgi:hypothetical protein